MPSPFLLYLLSNYHHTWHDSTMAQNLSKNSNSQIHSDVTMTSMTSFLLCRVPKTAVNSLYLNRYCYFIFYPIIFKLGRDI